MPDTRQFTIEVHDDKDPVDAARHAAISAADLVGKVIEERIPQESGSLSHGFVPDRAVEPLTDAIVTFAAELLQTYLDAGSERDVTDEDLRPTIEKHVKEWTLNGAERPLCD